MGSRERGLWLAVTLVLAGALVAGRTRSGASDAARPRAQPGVRISMAALHRHGGVPLGWQLTLPPGDAAAGRTTFDALGCPSCHRVAGEAFATDARDPRGPDLTGMGSHHPPGYFAEAVLNPDAVLLEGPGWIGADGRSTMPAYPDMTLGELADVVAYLASLQEAAPASCHAADAAPAGTTVALTTLDSRERPAPPPGPARAFFAQTYEVQPGRLDAFERWFAAEGRRAFAAADGLVSLETFVDAARAGTTLTTLVGFRDEAALRTFMADPATAALWSQFDAFVGPHGHVATDRPLVYRAPSLSAPPARVTAPGS